MTEAELEAMIAPDWVASRVLRYHLMESRAMGLCSSCAAPADDDEVDGSGRCTECAP